MGSAKFDNNNKFDVIILGASGHIGRFTILECIKRLKDKKWAVAGRNVEKLKLVLKWAAQRTNVKLSHIPIFLVDVKDEKSIRGLTEMCQVLINCCGPPQTYGETILSCCIQSGTHYVDASNDPCFNELMQLRYHDKACEKNVYVISSCGFHSFPMEIGLNILRQNFNGTINYVDAVVQYGVLSSEVKLGPVASATTWKTLVMSCANLGDLPSIRNNIRQMPYPTLMPKQPIKQLMHKPDDKNSETYVRFPFIDQQTVERSQYSFYAMHKQRPLQFYKYLTFPSQLFAVVFVIWSLVMSLLAQFEKTRRLLISYPRLFSLGLCSICGPDEAFMENLQFKIILHAKGWSSPVQSTPDSTVQESSLDHQMTMKISGTNPFYKVTSLCLVLSTLLILEEQINMPDKGGVYSPAVAFQKTSIQDKLAECTDYLTIEMCH